ncbi:MAG: sulfite exporter TauE/SafE family protein [Myxococcales bacterium]|nr:sulfite exporter TauE/SafE family protein [Myxococcales bacterium]MCB9642583.1 sulfite exporter TauE/SafE family protein [Myxococcales bacterium]
MDLWVTIGAFFVGVIASVYGAAVGGGALLTVPALVWMGVPVVEAVATSKLGSMGVSTSGLIAFSRAKMIDWRLGLSMAVLQLVGTAIGTYALLALPVGWVKRAVAFMILLILILLLAFPAAGLEPVDIPRNSLRYRMGFVCTFFLGVLTGFYQGGGGTLAAYIMILFFGQTFLQSAGTRKVPFFATTLLSLLILFPTGKVHLAAGIALLVGSMIGGTIGSHLAMKQGNRWVRTLFIIVVALSCLRMLLF